jgi:RNA polymerase sigma factor for flagellar operon FliA
MAHRSLVRRVAGRMRPRLPRNVDMDELMQAGMIGLHDAMTRFEEGRGATFETYAWRRIEGAMLDELRATDPLPREVRARLREVRAAVHALEHGLGRAPRAKEVASKLGWTLEEFHRCMADVGQGALRFDDEVLEHPDDDATTMAAALEDEGNDPLLHLQYRQREAALGRAFEALPERERYVMEMLYEHDRSLREIGEALGVSPSRVSQLHDEIIGKLRRRLRDW